MERVSLYASFLHGNIRIVQCVGTHIFRPSKLQRDYKRKVCISLESLAYLGLSQRVAEKVLQKSSENRLETGAVLWVDRERASSKQLE